MSWFNFFGFGRKKKAESIGSALEIPVAKPKPAPTPKPSKVRRYFFNQKTLQCYGTFFPYWDGWITAGHVLTSSGHKWPPFTEVTEKKRKPHLWPGGLDAALNHCRIPSEAPPKPYAGQKVKIMGFPAGSSSLETRHGEVYIERSPRSGVWIAQIHRPDEPVVSGMSGGPVICKKTDLPIGILITRNSPADLDRDQIADQSCDFISLSSIWYVLQDSNNMA